MVRIAIPKEIHPGERRVAATPQTILRLKKLGFDVSIESGAGDGINCPDAEYAEAGATVVNDTRRLWADSDVVMKVRPPEENHHLNVHEADLLPEETHYCSTNIGLRKACGETAVECFDGAWKCEAHAATERMNRRIATLLSDD